MAKKKKVKDYAEYTISYCPITGRKETIRHQLLNKESDGGKFKDIHG